MKKYSLIICFSLIGIFVFITSFIYKKNMLQSKVLIDNTHTNPISNLTLIYLDITMQNIEAYNLKDNHIRKEKTPLLSYTKGVIPSYKYNTYHNLVCSLQRAQSQQEPSYLHNYYEDDQVVVMSYLGTLSDTYIVDKNSNTPHPISFSSDMELPYIELPYIYVSYIKVAKDTLILLSMKANEYEAIVYTVSLNDYKVINCKSIPIAEDAVKIQAHAITNQGNCIFAMDKQLMTYNPFTDQINYTMLPFSCTLIVLGDTQNIFLGSVTENSIRYVLLDDHFNIIKTSKLSLPAPNAHIISLIYKNSCLYVATYHPNYILYPNYISVYALEGSKLIYCTAFLEKKHKALVYLYL